jgi:hypothetical protein
VAAGYGEATIRTMAQAIEGLARIELLKPNS